MTFIKGILPVFLLWGAFGKSGSKIDFPLLMKFVKRFENMGVNHIAFGTQGFGFGKNIDKHIDLMKKFKKIFDNRL